MPLFKDGSQLFAQAQDLVHRGEFDRAAVRFTEASVKFRKDGDSAYAGVAAMYSRLMQLRPGMANPSRMRELSASLRQFGPFSLNSGAREISASDLAVQLELAAAELQYDLDSKSGRNDPAARAQQLQGLSQGYRQLGNTVLFLPEFFGQGSTAAQPKVPYYAALSEEALGESLQSADPLSAAEHFQTAQNWWQQTGNAERAAVCAQKVGNLALRAKCWFCGREGSGHGIQFVSMSVDPVALNLVTPSSSPLPSIDGSGHSIFSCKGCYSSLSALADRIAAQRISEVERRLQYQIQQLQLRIATMPGGGGA